VEEGRGRLTLIANEVARLAAAILIEYAQRPRKIKDTKGQPEATADAGPAIAAAVPKRFLAQTPWPQLQHFARYLKAITLRLDKLRDPARPPARDAGAALNWPSCATMQEQRYWRGWWRRATRAPRLCGTLDDRDRMQRATWPSRWLLEELRVSFFPAQELRTPTAAFSWPALQAAGQGLGGNPPRRNGPGSLKASSSAAAGGRRMGCF
jgi:ATP-dependent helicase HrpA